MDGPRKREQRPTAYDADLAQAVLGGISNGTGLREICRQKGMPSKDTVYEWRRCLHGAPEDFAQRMEDARELGREALKDQMVEIADTCPIDKDAVAKAKLQIYVREKLLTNFGHSVKVEHSGAVDFRWAATDAEAVKDISRPTETPDDDADDDEVP